MNSRKPLLNISLDLDNKWSYLKTANRPAWKDYPSYLPLACRHIISVLGQADMHATMFIVGQDLLEPTDVVAIQTLATAGHDLGNHSFHHEPWLHLYDREKIAYELDKTDQLLGQIRGCHSLGFRGPGYSDSPLVHEMLAERGYRYCASQFSSCIGPLARAYYFVKTGLKREQRKGREKLFGSFTAGFGPNRHYPLTVQRNGVAQPNAMWMVPVTVVPLMRTPFHFSYLHYAAEKSTLLARMYLEVALRLCTTLKVQPSMLLHPLDFLGGDEEPDLAFFPGMKHSGQSKRARLSQYLSRITRGFQVQTLGEAVAAMDQRPYSRTEVTTSRKLDSQQLALTASLTTE